MAGDGEDEQENMRRHQDCHEAIGIIVTPLSLKWMSGGWNSCYSYRRTLVHMELPLDFNPKRLRLHTFPAHSQFIR